MIKKIHIKKSSVTVSPCRISNVEVNLYSHVMKMIAYLQYVSLVYIPSTKHMSNVQEVLSDMMETRKSVDVNLLM